jgi:DNA-directed RNA polymerase delta subunit
MQERGLDPSRRTLDAAYGLLRELGRPVNARELLARALSASGEADDLARAYTALNLDVRFVPVGRGEWGLREWGKGRKPAPDDTAEPEWE